MGRILSIKVREKGSRGDFEYKNKVSLGDPNLLALIFDDLNKQFGAPMRKACKLYLETESGGIFPFSV